MKRFTKIPVLIFISSFLLLSGCGGGGGGGSSGNDDPPSSTITSANADSVAAGIYSSSYALNGQAADGSGLLTGVAVQTPEKISFIDTLIENMYRGLKVKPANTVIGVSGSFTESCAGGGRVAISYNVADENTIPSNGDVITFNYKNCVEDGAKANGTVRMAFSNLTGTPDEFSAWGATIKFTFTNLSFSYDGFTDKLHGDMTLGFSQTGTGASSYSASGNSLLISVAFDGKTQSLTLSSYDYDGSITETELASYRSDFTVSGNMPGIGSNVAYVAKTLTDFKQQGSSNPHQGVMTIKATDGTSLKMTVLNTTQVQLELDTNADGTVDETRTLLWDDLLALM